MDNSLIKRQAAIDAIDKYSVWVTYTQGDSQKDEAEFVENIIKQTKKAIQSMLIEDLPSAQPIQTASNYLQSLPTSPLLVGKMPSAQPERTCVNCGRTVNNGGWYADGGTRCPIEEHYALPKDGYCHLWEKRNVTDDDYPERREE